MPYRVSMAPILERKAELDAMANKAVCVFRTNEPARLRYRLHEALNAARELGIEPYCNLNVIVRQATPFVFVTPRHTIQVDLLESDKVHHATSALFDVYTQETPANEFDVAGAILANPDKFELHFLHFTGDIDDVTILAQSYDYTTLQDGEKLILKKGGSTE